MSETIQEKINRQADDSQNEILWGKPANDILNGRDNSASDKPIRAIWEMVQNARDVSMHECNIVFAREKDLFVFKHDGLPFVNDTLNALVLQTSSKCRNDGDQVGQYGTGFLATHKFGRMFYLSGSLKLVDDEELYYNFSKLVVDRTPNTREGMVKSLVNQFNTIKTWREDLEHRSRKPEKWTSFTYPQSNDIESKNIEEAFEQAPELVPYILCLNENVKSITIQDDVKGNNIVFLRENKELDGETTLAKLYSTTIIITDRVKASSMRTHILSLESKTMVKDDVFKPKVTIILPIRDKKVYQLSSNIARLFIYLPLIGSEKWGCNYIIHSPLFTCSNDNRSSLRLVVDGQTEKDPAIDNQIIIREGSEIIFEFLKTHIAEWQDVHLLSPINFDIANPNKQLSEYYRSLKNNWLEHVRAIELVAVQTGEGIVMKSPISVYVLDATIADAIKKDEELLLPFYNVVNRMYNERIPISNLLVFWSEVFAGWYEGENNNSQIIDINAIIDYIDTNGLKAISRDDLLIICKYLRDSQQYGFFEKNILLTEDGGLTNKTEGYKSDEFCEELKSCIKILLPEYSSRFVEDSFSCLVSLSIFTKKNFKDAIATCNEALQTRIKSVADSARFAREKSIPNEITDGILSESERNALMNYCRMIVPRNSTAFQTRALALIGEYYNYAFDPEDILDVNYFEWRGSLRTLLCNVLTEFTILPEETKHEKVNWIRSMVSCVFAFADFSGMLQNYQVYLSQNAEFCYNKELKKDDGVPEKMKDIYNILASTEDRKVEIRKELFDIDFGKIALTDSALESIHIGRAIMKKILDSGMYFETIDSYEHKDLVMDIIDKFDNEEDGQVWREAFETIFNDTPALLAKLVLNKDNREPLIKIMKVKEKDRLSKVAEIIDDEDFFRIWDMGKAAWIEKLNEQRDFDQKKALGCYVEDLLRKELKEVLSTYRLEAKVDDVQGGQDIIVFINGQPIYYIEVKSRWVVADSITMSAKQLERSVEKKECYSLFAVEMVGFNSENVREHKYPVLMDDFINRIRVVTDIGKYNDDILPTKRDPKEQVHIGGDYKAIVPQNLIEKNHIRFKEFVDKVLKDKVEREIELMPNEDRSLSSLRDSIDSEEHV